MKILLFSNWSIDSGITQATAFPLIERLCNDSRVNALYFCTLEHPGRGPIEMHFKNTFHICLPLYRCGIPQFMHFVKLPLLLRDIVREHGIGLIWCKGATAGGIASLTHFLTDVPFVVDSFEPHSQYMLQSGTWLWSSPKYLLQKVLEGFTTKHALSLLPVSYRYRDHLLKHGVPRSKLFVIPCVVDARMFSFDHEWRSSVRKQLNIGENVTVGIYVGKYGGLYYDDDAFQLYKQLFEFFGSELFLIVVSETPSAILQSKFEKHALAMESVFFSKLCHGEVARFLSAADFAISTVKSVPAMQYCSPIKHGEYWAADLPIVSTLQFGDDAEIINSEGGGILVDINDTAPAKKFRSLRNMLGRRGSGIYSRLADKYRHTAIMRQGVDFVLERSVTIEDRTD